MMNLPRFTLAQLMAIVLCLGVGLAALHSANELWASVIYTLALLMVATALVGALVRKGESRATWTGFAVFGLVSLAGQLPDWESGGFGFGPIARPTLLIELLLTRLQPYIRPFPPGITGGTLGGDFLMPYEQVSLSFGIILFGLIGAVAGQLVAGREERSNI